MKKQLILHLFLIVFLSAMGRNAFCQAEVFVIRHAESTSAADNSPLLTEGFIRAHKLKVLLSKANISKIFVTTIVRNKQTAEPLWKHIGGLANQLVTYTPQNILQLATAEIAAGNRILIVGHSNTVPQIMTALGVASPQIGNEFDNLFQIIFRGNQKELLQFKYGL